jgi:hypothetical protein
VYANWAAQAEEVARLEDEALKVGGKFVGLQLMGGQMVYEDARPAAPQPSHSDAPAAAAAVGDVPQLEAAPIPNASASSSTTDDADAPPSMATTSPPGTPQQLEQLPSLQLPDLQEQQQWLQQPAGQQQWQPEAQCTT